MPRAPSDSLYSGSGHGQFNSPRLVNREAGFPNPRRALIGSNQLWRVNDSPYYRVYRFTGHGLQCPLVWVEPRHNKTIINDVHDGVVVWELFQHCWPFVWGIQRWPRTSPHKMFNNAKYWVFCQHEQAVEETVASPVVRDAITLVYRQCNDITSDIVNHVL